MKKFITTLALALLVVAASAQVQVQGLIGANKKIVAEHSLATDKVFAYSYLEASDAPGAYWQAIAEYNFWKLAAHIEYRTSFDGWRAAFAGISYPILSTHGMFSVSALARWEPGVIAGQIGTCNSYDFGWFDLYGYTDLWYDKGVQFYWEQRAYINLTKNIGVGFVLDTIFAERFYFTPFFGIRVRFGA